MSDVKTSDFSQWVVQASIPNGEVPLRLTWHEPLTVDDVDDIEYLLAGVIASMKRRAAARAFPAPAPQEG